MTLLAHWSERLHQLNACHPSIEWAATQETPLEAWRSCENGSWLLWIAATLNVDRRLIVTAACKCARLALVHVPKDENRPLKAIEAAERWVDGLATIEEVRRAAVAARDVYAAESTAPAVANAADAAAYAAYTADTAAYAADAAADAAAYAAYSAAVAAAADATCVTMLSQCADIVRSVISEDVMLEAWTDKEDAP